MGKNTSILLGDHFDSFIGKQVNSGKYASASEVVRAALRMFEYEEQKKEELVKALKKGEDSLMKREFSREKFLKELHTKHSK
jgi:antitoxin ParD1/3/4